MALSLGVYFALAPFGYAVFMGLLRPTRDPLRRAQRVHQVLHRAFRLFHGWLRGLRVLRFQPGGVDLSSLPPGPCVWVANHPTLTDVTAIIATLGGACTVVKPRLFRAWWIRPLMEGAQHIEGARSHLDTRRVLQEAVHRLEQGLPVLVFPEGTRSPPDKISPFGRGAFEIACRANVPLVPLLLRCDPPFLTKEVPLYRLPQSTPQLQLTVLPALDPALYANDSRRLRDATESLYRRLLDPPCARALTGLTRTTDAPKSEIH